MTCKQTSNDLWTLYWQAALTCNHTGRIFFLLLVFLSNNRLRRLQPFRKRREADHNLYGLQTVHKQERWRGILVLSLSPIWPMVRRRADRCGFSRSGGGCCDRWSWYEPWLFTNMAGYGNVLGEMIQANCQGEWLRWLRYEVADSVGKDFFFNSLFAAVNWGCHAKYCPYYNNETKRCTTPAR